MTPRSCVHTETMGRAPAVGSALALSALGHVLLFSALLLVPGLVPEKAFSPSVISVTMVALSSPATPGGGDAAVPAEPEPEPKPEPAPRPEPVQKIPEPVPEPVQQPVPEPEPPPAVVTLKGPEKAPPATEPKPAPKPKASLKRKTYQPEKAVQQAIERMEKKVERTEKDPIQEALDRMRRSVADQQTRKPAEGAKGRQQTGQASGVPGGDPNAGARTAELIDVYMMEIRRLIEQQWAFADLSESGRNLKATLVIKVMPNGEIKDIFFEERSGNRALDESAERAIMKANPLSPHPPGLIEPFVHIGINFTPEGLQ